MDELGYQKLQDPGDGIAVSPFGTSGAERDQARHASTEIKDRLKGAAFNEGFISAFRASIPRWIVSVTGRSICIRPALKVAIGAIDAAGWKQIASHQSDWPRIRYKIVKSLTEFRQFCHD
ncbi:hypothetical protein AAFO92_03300 [Roseovarius sp. CAU 1744]|uniref:hypothetical protein n=1 Tax=Roseovarius sp. CAU 1744 TaxID=3140368 RepID=UPI00325BC622